MKHHWIVSTGTDKRGTYTTYEQVDYVPGPQSSNVLADEIDGMLKSRAVRTLERMYDKVATITGSRIIICRDGDAA